MKISNNVNLENDAQDDGESIQLDIDTTVPTPEPAVKPKRTYKKKTVVEVDNPEPVEPVEKTPEVKEKKPRSEAQLEAWAKAVQARAANREKRKKEKEAEEEARKKDLEDKIILKAKRIKKSQERVLGNLDELKADDDDEDSDFKEPIKVKRTPRVKKVIIYKDDTDTTDYEEERVVKKRRSKKIEPEPTPTPTPPPPPPVKMVRFI